MGVLFLIGENMSLNEHLKSLKQYIVPMKLASSSYLDTNGKLCAVHVGNSIYDFTAYNLAKFNMYCIEISSDNIIVYFRGTSSEFKFPHISTEEEHFQLSLINDLSLFDFEFFQICKDLIDTAIENVKYSPVVNL